MPCLALTDEPTGNLNDVGSANNLVSTEGKMTTIGAIGVPELVMLVLWAALFGSLAAVAARHRHRCVGFWAALGCLLGPIAIIVVLLLPMRENRDPRAT